MSSEKISDSHHPVQTTTVTCYEKSQTGFLRATLIIGTMETCTMMLLFHFLNQQKGMAHENSSAVPLPHLFLLKKLLN